MSNSTDPLTEGWYETLEEESYSSKLIFSMALLVEFIVGCAANIVICLVIYYSKTMHTATDYYLFDLAVSDLLLTFPVLVVVYQKLSKDDYTMEYNNGRITCKFLICVQYVYTSLLWNHGILVMTALSIERYIAICCHFRFQRVPVCKKVVKIILVLWTIAIVETIPVFWTIDFIDTEMGLQCIIPKSFTAQTVTLTLGVMTFIIPLGIMVFVYSMISFRVNDHETHNMSYSMVNKSIRNGKNVTILIVALTVSFVVCWLPHFILKIFMYFIEIKTKAHLELFASLLKASIFNSWFSTVVNPLLFSLISVKFRKAFKMLWDRKIKKRPTHISLRHPGDAEEPK